MCAEHYYPWVPDNDADWDLIAAAPEMYAALKVLFMWGAAQIRAHEEDCVAGPLGEARRVLAKATGGAE